MAASLLAMRGCFVFERVVKAGNDYVAINTCDTLVLHLGMNLSTNLLGL